MRTRGDDDLDLVLAAREGDESAFGALFDRWFDRVFDVSFRILHDRHLAAEVAQDVFLVAWQQLATLRQPGSFGGWLLRMSRNRSLNRLERERRSVALGDEETHAVIDRRRTGADVSDVAEQAEQVDLVWAAAQALGERDASVLDLHLRHGFGAPEIAETLGVTTNNAHQMLFRLKDRLGTAIRGWVLWRNGSPSCPVLDAALLQAGIDRFGPDAVKAIDRHAKGCADCEERRTLQLSPQAMFAAVPVVVAGPFLRAQAASALAADGVPMHGSSALGDGGERTADDREQVGDEGGQDGDGSEQRTLRSAARVHAIMAVVAMVLVATSLVVLADDVGDDTTELATEPVDTLVPTTTDADATTSSSSSAATTTSSSSTSTTRSTVEEVEEEGGAGGPAVVPPGTGSPSTDPPPTDPPSDPTDPSDPRDPSEPTDPPTEPAPPLRIDRFEGTTTSVRSCREVAVGLVWATTGAEIVGIVGPGAPPGELAEDGDWETCTPWASSLTYVLTAIGPDGAEQTATVIVEPPPPTRQPPGDLAP